MQRTDPTPAVVVARAEDERPDTAEIRELAAAAGYAVADELVQRRREDPTYGVGRGKAEELARLVATTDVDAVIYDGSLSPGQTFSLGDLLPVGTAVVDRPRLVFGLFADATDSRAADLQLELARLRYELPRLREAVARDPDGVRLRPEGDGRVADVERRIESAERALDGVVDDRAARRAERRDAGFDLVALAGYANAGKSTLARRLADEVAASGEGPGGDRPFETLSTTTRRATVGGRRTAITDTVGFLDGVPHEAVRSFRATLDAVRAADCGLLVVDATDAPAELRRKLHASLTAIGETEGPLVPALSKADRLDADRLAAAADAYESAVDGLDERELPVVRALEPPIAVSARTGAGVDELGAAVADALPTATAAVSVPNDGDAQAALSWAYDHGVVEEVAYAGEAIEVDLAGRPDAVAAAERRLTGGRDGRDGG